MAVQFEQVDWQAVRRFYEAGHTREECRAKFDFSKRSWRSAVEKGLIRPRTPGAQVGPNATRSQVQQRLVRGMSYADVSAELGIAKSTVAFHARRIGRPVDERFNRRYDWEEVQLAHDNGMRALECCKHFGFSKATWSKAVETGRIKPRPHVIPLEGLLVKGRRTSRGHLKRRLLDAGLKENRCEICRITEWLGKPLSLQLHHKNGDGSDNRLPNLQLLCANCHSQTDTYGGRNGHRRSKGHLRLVEPLEDDQEEVA